ncbi:MAG: hypothetical protein IE931_05580 [Sphingobacteriales bacterium]|nr:hypothetical protein [Sphingobacteriales bacterium]
MTDWIFGLAGIIIGLISRFSMTKKESYDATIMLVKQLQENVNSNNKEIKELKDEVHEWREKYYKELEEKNQLLEEIKKLWLQLQKINKP